jgi:hypothetical protein
MNVGNLTASSRLWHAYPLEDAESDLRARASVAGYPPAGQVSALLHILGPGSRFYATTFVTLRVVHGRIVGDPILYTRGGLCLVQRLRCR